MSVERIWRWRCDYCSAVAEVENWGLPRGWIFIKAREIQHACPSCKESVPRERRGIPQVIAEK